jgi:hypothetical protein
MMRMNAGRTPKSFRVGLHELDGLLRTRNGAPGDQHSRHASQSGASDDFVAIVIEAVMCEIGADVDDRHFGSSESRR